MSVILLKLTVFLDRIHDGAAPPARPNIAMQNCTFFFVNARRAPRGTFLKTGYDVSNPPVQEI
jgi:hypothetical protein